MVYRIVSQLLDGFFPPTWAVSPAQNNPCLLAQIVRRTETVRQVEVQKEFDTYEACQSIGGPELRLHTYIKVSPIVKGEVL